MLYKKHIASSKINAKEGLKMLNNLNMDKVLFLLDDKKKLVGSLTDGDLRRGLISGLTIDDSALKFAKLKPAFIKQSSYSMDMIVSYREKFQILPILDDEMQIVDIINFRIQNSYLPVDAVLMAGGLGSRLKPLTDKIPKPLLKVGDKSSIEHNLDRLSKFGISKYYLCLNHMGNQIEKHLKNIYSNHENNIFDFQFIYEDFKMGTIGAVSKINKIQNDYVLITNADVITKIDYEKFFLDFENKNADLSMITIPYSVEIPYGVTSIETSNNSIVSLEEKPNYTHFCNAGIYLLKKSIISEIPKETHYDATDLIQKLIKKKYKIISYPTYDYWMDIGSIDDFKQANEDIKSLDL
tara:strand:+ start:181 stop:1239 length:1059 start_codon:yes stop_codon:yes gene_type:complete